MNQQYVKAVEMLCLELGLEVPKDINEITSIKVGEQECHITEHPAGRLLMFSRLSEITQENAQIFLEVSMFSQEEKKPMVGLDSESNLAILWNQQPLVQAERHTLYQQLELLSQYYDQIQSKLALSRPENSDVQDIKPGNFNPNLFLV
ncbi:Tir chaperone family protein [Vibrio azureus]|uniref:Uncharacterized protein n=1 Tax=Vibrio azureus NBRC 104587 TaxID=1219077 RepID=U3ATX5_9VIBR|nr:CesT family type III secretion system chaperone [Vibrio azureus]AUI86147.1 Tir chaperone family protein [Vibrio azureus]GAD76692.1 hypothetical protein VAZ01S_050_00040 [Vibrio azureus NBRC 104587]